VPMNGEPSAPGLIVPSGAYQLRLTAHLTDTQETELRSFGPAVAFRASSIDLSPTTQDTIALSDEGRRVMYSSIDASKTINLTYAYTETGMLSDGRTVEVRNIGVGQGSALGASLNQAGDILSLNNPGNSTKMYTIAVATRHNGDLQTFMYPSVTLAAGATQRLVYRDTWQTGKVILEIDVDSDGIVDETLQLKNQTAVFLPLVRR
jgi:hypothetical protein